MAVVTVAAQAQSTATFSTAGNQTWTCPSGVNSVQVEAWGGGGGGGGVGKNYAGGGGGAGGAYVRYVVPVTAGTTYNLTVGVGGAGGTGGASGTGGAGGTGAASYFGNPTAGNYLNATVLAVGGNGGGLDNTAGTSSNYTGGAGGSATVAGDVPGSGAAANTPGTNGASAAPAGAKTSGAGGAGAGATGSAAGGAGGLAVTSAGNGKAGAAPGGGGSGGLQVTATTNGTGGVGGAGQIILTWTVATAPSVSSSAATAITATSATLNGTVTSDGGSPITERGFVYSTASGVTISNNRTPVSGTTGAYTLNLTALSGGTTYYFDAYAINAQGTVLSTPELNFTTPGGAPPTLSAASGATVDGPFVVTFIDSPAWRANVTGITVGGSALSPSAYAISAGQITFTPAASTLLQIAGVQNISVLSSGYSSDLVAQSIGAGVATHLAITTQPSAPAYDGATFGTEPVVQIEDQYGNVTTVIENQYGQIISGTPTILAQVGAGSWTLNGTTSEAATSGTATFTNLSPEATSEVTSGTITFTVDGLLPVSSSGFTIPVFTPGNLAVEQLATDATSSTFSIIELSPTSPNQSTPVNAYPIPSTGSSALRQSSAGSTGRLATSNDGTLLAFTGFEDANGVPDETAITQRGVGTLGQNYQYTLQASYTDAAGSGDQTRGATFNNGTWYMSDKNGIWLNGGTSAVNPTNVRPIKSFGGTVYALSDNTTVISSVSADGTILTGLNGLPNDASAVDFYMISSGVNGSSFDVLYVLDGATVTKYSLVGTTWQANGAATSLGVTGDGFCAVGNAGSATLYLTTGTSNTVYAIQDLAGYNVAPSITPGNNVKLFTGSAGYLKGIAFAPLANPLPDLTIGVSAPQSLPLGAAITYTLTVGNSGAAAATGVNFQFTLPTGVAFTSAVDNGSGGFTVPSAPTTNSAGQQVLTFTNGTLASGASDSQIVVTANAAVAGTYKIDAGQTPAANDGTAAINTAATTTSPIPETNGRNNYPDVGISTVVSSLPDLTVDVSTSASDILLNGVFSYTLTVGNVNGTAAATGIPLNFTLPSGLTFVPGSATDTNGSFTATAPTVSTNGAGQEVISFSGGSLAAQAADTITLNVTGSTIGTYTVASGGAVVNPGDVIQESNYANDSSTFTPSVTITASDLVVTSSLNQAIAPGDTADTYTVYVGNVSETIGGVTDGSTVTISETLPTGLTPAASMNGTNINGWYVTVSGQTVTGTRDDVLAAGESYPPLTITFSVDPSLTGTVSFNASVSGGGEVSSSNDSSTYGASGSDTETVTVNPTPITTVTNLLVTRGNYVGSASSLTVGQLLPNGSQATVSGAYPYVWGNETPDVSFGVTAPIYLDVITTNPTSPILSTTLSNSPNVTALIKSQLGLDVTTSFSSKSEIGLHLTPDGQGVTFMAYVAPANTLDVSNANTPYHDDPTSPLANHGNFQHAVVQMDYLGNVQVTPVDAYSGDNSRNAILGTAADGNSYYYMAGSAGNSGTGVTGSIMSMLAGCTGIQMIEPGGGGLTTAVGKPFGTYGSSTGYQLGYPGLSSDKTGKDMNLRGLTLNPYNGTLYASKGSGGSGVDTIYQIGSAGLPTPANANTQVFTIPSGFPTANGSGLYPFGMWFANAYTLYVADEGEAPSAVTFDSASNTYDQALPANNPKAGLQKWVNSQSDGSGTWTLVYTLNSGLNLGVPYSYTIGNGYPAPGTINPVTGVPWQPANNGLRNLTGQFNGDGTVTLYAITSTVSGETDWGADPNQLVSIVDTLSTTTLPTRESFTVLEEAGGQDVLRGVELLSQGAPVNSGTASNVSVTGATLNGTVDPNGTDTTAYFQYGTSTSYGNSTSIQDLGSGTSPVSFSSPGLTGLQAGTTYYYRLVTVSNGVTTVYATQTFTTPAAPAPAPTDTPTMPAWALFMLAMALMGFVTWHHRRTGDAC